MIQETGDVRQETRDRRRETGDKRQVHLEKVMSKNVLRKKNFMAQLFFLSKMWCGGAKTKWHSAINVMVQKF